MEIVKKYKWLLIIVLVLLAGIFSFFIRMYQNDMSVLTGFVASYERFDKAISAFSISSTDELENGTRDAFRELNTKATFRISSLIKNEKEAMAQAREVADFSGRELNSLIAYKVAIQNKNPAPVRLLKEYEDLTTKRKAAYARFQELGK